MTSSLHILLSCMHDMYIHMYITHVYYAFHKMLWFFVVFLFIKCIMSMLMTNIVNDFFVFKCNLIGITHLNLQFPYNV